MFDHLDARITPSDTGIVFDPPPTVPLDMGDPNEVLVPIIAPTSTTTGTPISATSDTLIVLAPTTPV